MLSNASLTFQNAPGTTETPSRQMSAYDNEKNVCQLELDVTVGWRFLRGCGRLAIAFGQDPYAKSIVTAERNHEAGASPGRLLVIRICSFGLQIIPCQSYTIVSSCSRGHL